MGLGNIFSGLFGGGGAPGSAGYMSGASGAMGNAGDIYNTDRSVGETNLGNWNQDNPLYRQSALNLAQQLGQAPTQQQRAQVLGAENNNAASMYSKVRAQLLNDAASRGLDTAGDQGTQSSVLGGGLSSLSNAYANTLANNATNYYNQYESPMAQQARLAQQAQIYSQLASGDYSSGMGAMNDASNGYMNMASDYGNLANLSIQQQQADQTPWNSIFGGLSSGIGQGLGSWFEHGFQFLPSGRTSTTTESPDGSSTTRNW